MKGHRPGRMPTMDVTRRTCSAVFLLAMGVLLMEIALTRVFSLVLWYHFAFVAISLALFGSAAGGVAAYCLEDRIRQAGTTRVLARAASAFPWLLAGTVLFLAHSPFSPSPAGSGAGSLGASGSAVLATIFLVTGVPFFVAGFLLSVVLRAASDRAGRLYAFDLTGAACGCLVALPALGLVGGTGTVLTAGVAVGAAGLLFASQAEPVRDGSTWGSSVAVAVAAASLSLALLGLFELPLLRWASAGPLDLDPSQVDQIPATIAHFRTGASPSLYSWLADLAGQSDGSLPAAALVTLVLLVAPWKGLLMAVGVGALLVRRMRRTGGLRIWAPASCLFACLCVAGADRGGPFDARFSKGAHHEGVEFAGWNSFSQVAVTGDLPVGRPVAWGLSPLWEGDGPPQKGVLIDGAAGTAITRFHGDLETVAFLRHDLTTLGYAIAPRSKVAVIGPGGGLDVLAALLHGVDEVVGIELNPLIVQAVDEEFGDYSGHLYSMPGVRIEVDEGRSFLRRSGETFDLIQLSLIDTWAATAAGAYALSENSLYTAEAFGDYLDRLAPDGVLAMTRFRFDPPLQVARLVSLAREAIERRGGRDWADRIAVVSAEGASLFLLKKTPFTVDEVAALEARALELGFDPEVLPGRSAPGIYGPLLAHEDPEPFYGSYQWDLRPATDNRPFFFHFVKPGDFLGGSLDKGDREEGVDQTFNFFAVSILVTLLGAVTLLATAFLAVPLALRHRGALAEHGADKARTLAFFGLVGLGFMLVEIPLIQEFVRFLGHPTYALAVILFSLLLFGGLGSRTTQAVAEGGLVGALRRAAITVVILAPLAAWVLPGLLDSLIHLALPARCVVAALLLAPLGFALGRPFPLGVRLTGAAFADIVPWTWAANGAASVVGSVLAICLAMNFGFPAVIGIGAACYAGLLAAVPGRRLP